MRENSTLFATNITAFYLHSYTVWVDCYASILVARYIDIDVIEHWVSKSVKILVEAVQKAPVTDIPTCRNITGLNLCTY